jgi:ABC-type oligopeptide transport system substrate-binding subunit
MKKPVRLIALLLVIASVTIVVWSACYKHEPIKPYQNVLKLGGMGGKPGIINPILTDSTISQALVQMIFNGLVRINKEMLPEPADWVK